MHLQRPGEMACTGCCCEYSHFWASNNSLMQCGMHATLVVGSRAIIVYLSSRPTRERIGQRFLFSDVRGRTQVNLGHLADPAMRNLSPHSRVDRRAEVSSYKHMAAHRRVERSNQSTGQGRSRPGKGLLALSGVSSLGFQISAVTFRPKRTKSSRLNESLRGATAVGDLGEEGAAFPESLCG